MSKAVYKYELPVDDEVSVLLPKGAEVLSVAFQRDTLCIWALVDTDTTIVGYRVFAIRGTGHPADGLGGHGALTTTFLGTAFHPLGLVFHVWERI